MTEEFEEEVEFEFLQDLGRSGSGARETGIQYEGLDLGTGEGPRPPDGPAPPRTGLLWRVADAVRTLLSVHRNSMSHNEEQQLDAEYRQYSLRLLLEQDLFLQEDLELLELLDPGVLSVGSVSSLPVAPPRYRLLPSTWDMWILAVLVAVIAALSSIWGRQGLAALLPWVLVLVAFVLVWGAGLWRMAQLQESMRARGALLESLAQDSRALTALVRKALRLVQETEVISRGFTLVSAACPFNRAEPQLPGLRKACYRSLNAAIRAYRHATRHMLSAYPLDPELDDAAHYLCMAPLTDLGLGLGEGHLSDERARELTDDFALPALKVLFQLFVGQSSEFFRRLALLLSTRREEKGRLAYRAAAEVTEPLHLALRGCLGDLRRSYDLHRCSETRRGTRDSDGADRARRHCRELGALHAAVQSLQMHLRALLSEVIMLEDELEMLLVSPETADAASATALWDKLRLLRPHMHASRGCWEEAVTHVGRIVRLSSSQSGTPGTPDESAPRLQTSTPHPVSRNWDRDSVPEEQELEAYASDSDSDSDWRGALSSAEQDWRRRGREESRPVLLELKSVLGLRASEGERLKWKQLLFRDQAAPRTTLPRKPSEPCGSSDPREPCSQQNNHEFTTLCTSGARLNFGCSEGGTAPPVPHASTAHEGGKERAPPSGRSLNAGFEGQAKGPQKSCTTDTIHHQKAGTGLKRNRK